MVMAVLCPLSSCQAHNYLGLDLLQRSCARMAGIIRHPAKFILRSVNHGMGCSHI